MDGWKLPGQVDVSKAPSWMVASHPSDWPGYSTCIVAAARMYFSSVGGQTRNDAVAQLVLYCVALLDNPHAPDKPLYISRWGHGRRKGHVLSFFWRRRCNSQLRISINHDQNVFGSQGYFWQLVKYVQHSNLKWAAAWKSFKCSACSLLALLRAYSRKSVKVLYTSLTMYGNYTLCPMVSLCCVLLGLQPVDSSITSIHGSSVAITEWLFV